jgi:hypothetical protein
MGEGIMHRLLVLCGSSSKQEISEALREARLSDILATEQVFSATAYRPGQVGDVSYSIRSEGS